MLPLQTVESNRARINRYSRNSKVHLRNDDTIPARLILCECANESIGRLDRPDVFIFQFGLEPSSNLCRFTSCSSYVNHSPRC